MPNPDTPHQAPAWFDEFLSARLYVRHIVLTGNLRDVYPVWSGADPTFVGVNAAVARLVQSTESPFSAILCYDPVEGLRPLGPMSPAAEVALRPEFLAGHNGAPRDPLQDLERIHALLAERNDLKVALIVDYASHLASSDEGDRDAFFVAIDKLSRCKSAENPCPQQDLTVWLADQTGHLPEWFTIGNGLLREIHVDLPDLEARFQFAETVCADLAVEGANDERARNWALQQFALECDGETLDAMRAIATVARFEGISLTHISDAIRIYRTGLRRNPWGSKVLADRVRHAQSLLGQRIKGQEHALERTVDILSRSLVGLSGAQSGSRHSKPRGVMFFAPNFYTCSTKFADFGCLASMFSIGWVCRRQESCSYMQHS